MARSSSRSTPGRRRRVAGARRLVLAVLLLAIASLLPARWLRFTGDLAAVIALPMAPLGDLSNSLRRWLRPGDDPLRGLPAVVETIAGDRDAYRALWHAERLRNEELVERLEDRRLAEQFDQAGVFEPVRAEIVGRSPDRRRGAVRINAGTAAGLRAGDPVVFRGAHLVGRIAEDPARLTALVVPAHDSSIGRIHAAHLPDREPADPAPATTRLLLTPRGDGTFLADVDRERPLAPGDEIVLDDPAWPETARGMILGVVESVEPRDDQPTRARLSIRPRYDIHDLRTVVVKALPGALPPDGEAAP